MGPPQGSAEGEENLPHPAAHTPLDAPQDPIGFLGTQGTLLAHGQLVISQHSQALSTELLSSRSAPLCIVFSREKQIFHLYPSKDPSSVTYSTGWCFLKEQL